MTPGELEAARLVEPDGAAPTRSQLERRFLGLVRAGGLARPLVNSTIGPYEVDSAWLAERVLVEVDGWDGPTGTDSPSRATARRDGNVRRAR